MSEQFTHKITITVEGTYLHGEKTHARVSVTGDGSLDHMLAVFRSSLVAGGYSPRTAATLIFNNIGNGDVLYRLVDSYLEP